MLDVRQALSLDEITEAAMNEVSMVEEKTKPNKKAAQSRYNILDHTYDMLVDQINATDTYNMPDDLKRAWCQLTVAMKRVMREELKIMGGRK